MNDEFAGFSIPEKNYFHMPNEWINICSAINNLAELKIIQYVIRHTWGYREYGITKAISIDEFMKGRKRGDGTRIDMGTGLSRQSVIDGIKKAVDDGYLICEVDESDKARVKKSYALKMREVKEVDTGGLNPIPPQSKSYTPPVKEVDTGGLDSLPRSEKDTLEKHLHKNTGERVCGKGDQQQQGTPTPANASQKNSSQATTPTKPVAKKPEWLLLLDHWDSTQGKGPRPKWVVDEAKDLASRMEATPEQMDVVCSKLKTLGKPLTFESMYNHWHLLKQQEGPPERKPGQPPGKANNPANNLVALAAAQRAQRQQTAGGGQ